MWFAILLGFLVTNAFGTKPAFTSFKINLSCSEPGQWCVQGYFYEADNLEDDDVFSAQFCSNKPNIRFSVDDLDLGGDGLWDHNYEIDYTLYHTCGNQKFVCTKSKSSVLVTTDKNATQTFNIALNKSAVVKRCYFPDAFIWITRTANKNFDQKIRKGAVGKVKTWSRYRHLSYDTEDI